MGEHMNFFLKHIKIFLVKFPRLNNFASKVYKISSNIVKPKIGLHNRKILNDIVALRSRLNLRSLLVDYDGIVLTLGDNSKFFLDVTESHSLLSVPETGFFEAEETDFLKNIVGADWNIIDVGANFGWYTVHFALWTNHNGSVHSFEPVPTAYKSLSRHVLMNSHTSKVFLNRCAVGAENGFKTIYSPIGRSTAFSSEHQSGTPFNVESIQLDKYVKSKRLKRVDFIKIDVEGGELNVLRGAKETIQKYHPRILLEVESRHAGLFGYSPLDIQIFFRQHGYIMYFLNSGKLCRVDNILNAPAYNFYCEWNKDADSLKTNI